MVQSTHGIAGVHATNKVDASLTLSVQAIGRICRFGQKYTTNVYFLQYQVYIEQEWIESIHAQKQAEQHRIMFDNTGEDEDDVADMHLSHCERLRLHLSVPAFSQASFKRPIEDDNPYKHANNLQEEGSREYAGIQDGTHTAKKYRRTEHA